MIISHYIRFRKYSVTLGYKTKQSTVHPVIVATTIIELQTMSKTCILFMIRTNGTVSSPKLTVQHKRKHKLIKNVTSFMTSRQEQQSNKVLNMLHGIRGRKDKSFFKDNNTSRTTIIINNNIITI